MHEATTPEVRELMEWDAVVLAGGPTGPFGGIEQCELRFEGRSLLNIALDAVRRAENRVVVGPDRPGMPADCRCVIEQPRFAGIVAALRAGLAELDPDDPPFVAVVAADQPYADDALAVVLSEVAGRSPYDGWVAADPAGRSSPLLAVYRKAALASAMERLRENGLLDAVDIHHLVAGLALKPVRLLGFLVADVDGPEDVTALGIEVPAQQ
jgi:molybdopterin-guanine dinucleotide biosynthesis protein A